MSTITRSLPAVLLSLLGTAPVAQAADSPQTNMQVDIQAFHWREFGGAGERLLQEKGARLAVGGAYDNFQRTNSGVLYSINGKLYLGTVNYDGQTQSGIAATTDTRYLGVNLEALGGYRIGQGVSLDVFGGIGLDDWLRSIADGTSAIGTPVYGYDEYYTIAYGKVGLGFFRTLANGNYRLQAGAKLPVYTSEYVDLGDGATLHPGIKPSVFANFQFDFGSGRHSRFAVALYYDSYRFCQSDPELLTSGGVTYVVVQPRSHMDVYGLRAGYYFF
jgi:hypothetical protein